MESTSMVRIYVACLASYNSGVLHGRWIDCTSKDQMLDDIAAMLRDSPYPNVKVVCPDCKGNGDPCERCKSKGEVPSAEEWAVHDYECEYGSPGLGEHPDLDDLVTMAEGLEEHGEAYMAWHRNDPNHNLDVSDFEDAYLGEWDSLADYVQDFWEQTGDMPKAPKGQWWHPANFIDWESMARDLELNGDVWVEHSGGKVWVFSNR